MSCNTDEEVRVILKYSTIAGTEPTIPASGDHEDGTWLPTDLYVGELFMNSVDEKLWIRTDNGIVGIGGTAGATFSGIYDYVHISGGTYSGEVYAPTFSSIGIVAQNIYGDIFQGNAGASASFIGSFFGDGSGLTGLICEWLGGTVSAPVHFTDRVDFTNDIYIDGAIYSNNPNIAINSSLEITGGVSASIFYGDGSGLTNLPTGTYSDTYTSTAALTGNTILFTRNDASDYSVDLTPILATQGVAMIQWDDTTDVLTLYMNDSTQLGITIDTFSQVSSTGPITAPEFYGGTFYGSFVGDMEGVVGATGATGAAGATGPAANLNGVLVSGNETNGQDIIITAQDRIYFSANDYITTLPDDTGMLMRSSHNIDNIGSIRVEDWLLDLYTTSATESASITVEPSGLTVNTSNGTGLKYMDDYSATYTNRSLVDKEYVDNASGGGTLEQTLALGNDSGTFSIMMGTATTIGTHGGTGRLLLDSLGDGDAIKMDASNGTGYARAVVDGFGEVNFIGTNGTDTSDMFINNVGIQVSTSTGVGIEYTSDYSATYTNRSLVDKEYVDTHSGGATGLGSVLAIDNKTGGYNINLNDTNAIISDDNEKSITFEETRALISNTSIFSTEGNTYSQTGILEVKNGPSISQLQNITTNDIDGTFKYGAAQVTDRLAAIIAHSPVIGNQAYVKADTGTGLFPVAEVRLNATDGSNISYMKVKPGTLEIGGTNGDGFQGLRYAGDYSADYSNRSLVDKEYVDNAVGASSTLEQTLILGNTTGTQSIFISSSASQIQGYNGINQHWYDATNPILGDYYRIENGTGASSSYIQIEDDVRGNIRIANNNLFDTASSYSERTSVDVGQSDIQHNATTRDYVGGTVWSSTNQSIYSSGSDMVTRDYILDTTGWVSTSTTGVYLQAGKNGGLSASDITMTPDSIISRTENDGYSWTQIEQKSDAIIVSGSSSHFKGLEYTEDYSAAFTNRSLVDKAYVDSVSGGGGGGVGTASATMFNSVVSPAVVSGSLPWYRLNVPAPSFSVSNYVLATNQISYSTTNLVAGETINEVAVYCASLLAAATASIALYSISLDANGNHYPSTLLTIFGDVSLATTGRKTITGLSYIIPASPYGIYYTAILRTGAAGSPAITGPINSDSIMYHGSLDSTSMNRPMTSRPAVAFSSFPSTITSASFSTYTNSTTLPFIGFR